MSDDFESFLADKKRLFLGIAHDSILSLCIYGRKNCEDVSVDDVESLLNNGHVSMSEIFEEMKKSLKENFPQIKD